jgi:hypothetical protein
MPRSSKKSVVPQAELSIAELLNLAKINILNGQDAFRIAAEFIAEAAERGATQREIASGVGKSVGWVNGLT